MLTTSDEETAAWPSVPQYPLTARGSEIMAPMSWVPPRQIRAVAIGVVRRGEEILVLEGFDSSKNETFYRPLGGGIEFGETAAQALEREFREEIATGLEEVRDLGTIENVFVKDGRPGHEIVHVFEARLTASELYGRDQWDSQLDGSLCRVLWKDLASFSDAPLYPDGLLDLLAGRR
jgi:ADP-ribose pyrophosphatase YjhB (NUDIX family)